MPTKRKAGVPKKILITAGGIFIILVGASAFLYGLNKNLDAQASQISQNIEYTPTTKPGYISGSSMVVTPTPITVSPTDISNVVATYTPNSIEPTVASTTALTDTIQPTQSLENTSTPIADALSFLDLISMRREGYMCTFKDNDKIKLKVYCDDSCSADVTKNYPISIIQAPKPVKGNTEPGIVAYEAGGLIPENFELYVAHSPFSADDPRADPRADMRLKNANLEDGILKSGELFQVEKTEIYFWSSSPILYPGIPECDQNTLFYSPNLGLYQLSVLNIFDAVTLESGLSIATRF